MHNQAVMDAIMALGAGFDPAFFNIEPGVYARRYPEFNYASMVPVITEGSPWARGVMFRSSDFVGKAEWFSAKANDMPYVDITRDQFLTAFHMAGIGYQTNLEEIAIAQMEGRDLNGEKATAARRTAERFLYGVALLGHADKGWTGALNDPTVPRMDAANNGNSNGGTASTQWRHKTPDQILDDINQSLILGYVATLETELADTILLPTEAFLMLATRRLDPAATATLMSFVQQNNVFTAETGRPLLIRGLRALRSAGVGGVGRMVTYRRDPDVLRFHLPMPHVFLPAFQQTSTTWETAGIMRTGGTEWRLPMAGRYTDGVTPVPS